MDDLGNAVVVVVIFCDIVSSLLHFFFGIFHSTADMGGPDHGNIIFGISGQQWYYTVGFRCIHRENERQSPWSIPGATCSRYSLLEKKRLILAVCKVSGLFKIITEMLLVFIIYNQHFDRF